MRAAHLTVMCLLLLLPLECIDATVTLQDVTSVAGTSLITPYQFLVCTFALHETPNRYRVVSAVGGIYVRSTALQELRPLSATSPSGPVCSTPGASVSAPSIATESVRV